MNITRGKQPGALKVLVYGPEGIGKSTFASRFPAPVFIDTEGSTRWLDVARYDAPMSWQMLLDEAADAARSGAKTLVIDTADWAERLCIQAVCSRAQKTGIEDFGYGKGYTYNAEEFGKLLNQLTDINNQGMHIVITGHAACRKFEQPDEMGAYDRYELKTSKQVASMLKEWCDIVLFVNYETIVVQDENKKKHAQGAQRVMYTCHHACWDAKNRHGLPPKLPFDLDQIAHLLTPNNTSSPQNPVDAPVGVSAEHPTNIPDEPRTPVSEPQETPQSTEPPTPNDGSELPPVYNGEPHIPASVPAELRQLMEQYKVSIEEIIYAVAERGFYPMNTPFENYDPAFVQGCLIGAWDQVYALIQKNREKLPF